MRREMKKRVKAFCSILLRRENLYPEWVESLPGKRFMVLSPHPDDEVLGCGGIIARLVESGKRVEIVHLTDGERGNQKWKSSHALAEMRRKEALAAATILGAEAPTFLGLPDLGLSGSKTAEELLREIIVSKKPDAIFLPFFLDPHLDHEATARLLARILESEKQKPFCYIYETWMPVPANAFVDISGQIEKKLMALEAHASQNSQMDLVDISKSLSRYRAIYSLGKATYAEAFLGLDAGEYLELGRGLFHEA